MIWDRDVVEAILIWLPRNDLLRMQLVCSKWYELRVPRCIAIDTWQYDHRRWIESALAEPFSKLICGDEMFARWQKLKPITFEFMQTLARKV